MQCSLVPVHIKSIESVNLPKGRRIQFIHLSSMNCEKHNLSSPGFDVMGEESNVAEIRLGSNTQVHTHRERESLSYNLSFQNSFSL